MVQESIYVGALGKKVTVHYYYDRSTVARNAYVHGTLVAYYPTIGGAEGRIYVYPRPEAWISLNDIISIEVANGQGEN